jgi:hypothetical protein
MVHFIRGELAWACKRYGVHGIGNCGQASNVGLFRDSWEWTSIVSRFSERQLTYKSDTLAALQGIVNRIKEVTQDIYCMGLTKLLQKAEHARFSALLDPRRRQIRINNGIQMRKTDCAFAGEYQ